MPLDLVRGNGVDCGGRRVRGLATLLEGGEVAGEVGRGVSPHGILIEAVVFRLAWLVVRSNLLAAVRIESL